MISSEHIQKVYFEDAFYEMPKNRFLFKIFFVVVYTYVYKDNDTRFQDV